MTQWTTKGAISTRPPWTLIVPSEDDGIRADVAFARHFPGLSRRLVKQLALSGNLFVDCAPVAPSFRVSAGQNMLLRSEKTLDSAQTETEAKLLRVSPRYVYFAKPSGMHTVSRFPDEPGTLAHLVAQQFPECRNASPDPREAGAIHRLDRFTSGVVAFARDRQSWMHLRQGFSQRKVRKLYIARCCPVDETTAGWPPIDALSLEVAWLQSCAPIEGLSDLPDVLSQPSAGEAVCVRVGAPIGRGSQRNRVKVRSDGIPSESMIQSWSTSRLLRKPVNSSVSPSRRYMLIDLLSGARHQARIHLAWIGWPIENDKLYGDINATGPLMLHAYMLDLSPVDPDELGIFCDPPGYFFN